MTTTQPPVIDRNGLEVLSPEECWKLVGESPIGRLAFLHEGNATMLPVNHALIDHHIVFRSTRGAKFDAAVMAKVASFEVDSWDIESRTGWSVLLSGTLGVVTGEAQNAQLDDIGLQPWAPLLGEPLWFRFQPSDISGRRILGAS